jgi:hypothetical protein
VQLCFPGPIINTEIKMVSAECALLSTKCISVISEILEAIGIWVPSAEKLMNSFSIYGG